MNSSKWIASVAVLLALACAKGPEGASKKVNLKNRQADLAAIETAKQALDRKREEFASLIEQAAGGAAVTPQIDATNAEITRMSDEVGRKLAEYINVDPPLVGEPMRPDQQTAIRLKSAEDIIIAKEFISLGGDYRKAIDIYSGALAIDPDNPELKAAMADAESKRYMSAERFSQVGRGMTESEVIGLLGRPLARNVREYPEKKVSAWFYPKNDSGEAAGVFLSDKKTVYSTDFNAVKRTDKQ